MSKFDSVNPYGDGIFGYIGSLINTSGGIFFIKYIRFQRSS